MDIVTHPAKNLRTPEERAAVKAEIVSGEQYAGKTTEEIAAILCTRPKVANPEPAQRVSKPMTVVEIMGMIPKEELDAVAAVGLLDDVRETIKAQEHEELANWAALGLKQEWITADTAAALTARAQETEADPAYQQQVLDESPLDRVCGRPVGGISVAELSAIILEA